MKTIYIPFLFLSLLPACGPEHVSDQDLEGHTYSARFRADSSPLTKLNGELAALETMEYHFRKRGKGSLKAGLGELSTAMAISWQVKNDSLLLESRVSKDSMHHSRWFISKRVGGYLLNDGKNKIELTSK